MFRSLMLLAHSVAASSYAGHLELVIADVKRPLACLEDCITVKNAEVILLGLKEELHCNAVRVYVDPDATNPMNYSFAYTTFVEAAKTMGMKVYANPLGTGNFGKSNTEMAKWIADYANLWKPDFLGPFNEPGMHLDDMTEVVTQLRQQLKYSPKIVGPDLQHTSSTITKLGNSPDFGKQFDIIASHNAVQDTEATPWAWWKLSQLAGSPVWASENPRDWSVTNDDGVEIGVKSVVDSAGPVPGLVVYLAYPNSIDHTGLLTKKGQSIAQGIAPALGTTLV